MSRAYMPDFEYRGYPWKGGEREVERFSLGGQGGNRHSGCKITRVGTNTLVKCDFVKRYAEDGGSPAPFRVREFLSTVTGKPYIPQDIEFVGERIWNLIRLYNLREGITRAE